MDDTIKNEDRCALCEVNHPHPERIQYALTHKLDDETSLRLSELFKVLGDKTRIKLLSLLVVEEEMCVCDISCASCARPGSSSTAKTARRPGIPSQMTMSSSSCARDSTTCANPDTSSPLTLVTLGKDSIVCTGVIS